MCGIAGFITIPHSSGVLAFEATQRMVASMHNVDLMLSASGVMLELSWDIDVLPLLILSLALTSQ